MASPTDLPPTEQQEHLDILYQDAELIAIDKPAGLLVHKSPIDKRETRYAMKILRNQIGQWVYPVHRLDKPTSGLLLFALSSESAKAMSECFMQRDVSKTYQALVRGFLNAPGEIDHPLKEIAAFKDQQTACDARDAQSALTAYRPIARYELPFADGRFPTSRYTLLTMSPHTGRKHQLRRHAKHISHPIVGDVKYGKGQHNQLFRNRFDCHRLLLAAVKLSFVHPFSAKKIEIDCPLEASFSELLEQIDAFKVST